MELAEAPNIRFANLFRRCRRVIDCPGVYEITALTAGVYVLTTLEGSGAPRLEQMVALAKGVTMRITVTAKQAVWARSKGVLGIRGFGPEGRIRIESIVVGSMSW